MSLAFYNKAVAALEEEIHRMTEILSGGNMTTFEDYRRFTGEIAGFRKAVKVLDEVMKQMEKA